MNQQFSVVNALAITFEDPTFVAKVNSIREKYDKAYPRWMPHINLFFPFMTENQFNSIKYELTEALSKVNSFTINLKEIESFSQKKEVTCNLRPDQKSLKPLEDLFTVVQKIVKMEPKHGKFVPHLTLGQCPKKEKDAFLAMLKKEFDNGHQLYINKLDFLTRTETTPFVIGHSLLLKSNQNLSTSVY